MKEGRRLARAADALEGGSGEGHPRGSDVRCQWESRPAKGGAGRATARPGSSAPGVQRVRGTERLGRSASGHRQRQRGQMHRRSRAAGVRPGARSMDLPSPGRIAAHQRTPAVGARVIDARSPWSRSTDLAIGARFPNECQGPRGQWHKDEGSEGRRRTRRWVACLPCLGGAAPTGPGRGPRTSIWGPAEAIPIVRPRARGPVEAAPMGFDACSGARPGARRPAQVALEREGAVRIVSSGRLVPGESGAR